MRAASRGVLCVLIGLFLALDLRAQSAGEHASHHPAPAAAGAAAPAMGGMPMAGGSPAPAGGGGMMGGMGDMMKGMMGGVPPKELYPELMSLPELTPEKRQEVDRQAGERMHAGSVLMGEALDALNTGTQASNYAGMHEATVRLREGIGQIESGVAARRALADGSAPREVALAWFKREMNLPPDAVATAARHPFGGSRFHLGVIGLLAAFAAVMIAMYFFKMRRAHALLARLADGGASATVAEQPAVAGIEPAVKPATTLSAAGPAKPATPPPVAPPAGPVTSGWKGILRANSIFEETPGVKTFRFTAMDGGPIPFTYLPGQYLTVFPVINGKRTPRSYTMASSPTQRHYCELTVKREADGHGVSRYLHDGLQEGELLEAAGPIGKFIFTGAEAKNIVLISAGVGITPFMSAIRYLTDVGWPGDIFFLHTCRHVSDFIFRPELEMLCARHPRLHMVVNITQPQPGETWTGPTGRLTKEMIARSVPDIATRRVHICGPVTMMKAAQAALLELDVPAAQVKTEGFGATAVKAPAGDGEKPTEAPDQSPPEVAVKPVEEAPADQAPAPPDRAPAAPAAVSVTFKKSGKSAPLPPDKSILEASEDAGVNIDYECRVGTCGQCKVPLLAGQVTMEIEDALSAEEKAAGTILACQAKSTAACTVDA